MPTYERFEDLPVWQQAAKLYEAVDAFLARQPHGVTRSFADQLERAALSVSNNIAEGFERGTTNELLMFIYIARGSAGETRHLNDTVRRQQDTRRRADDFQKRLLANLPPDHPLRREETIR
jgi:four helix bundle protein